MNLTLEQYKTQIENYLLEILPQSANKTALAMKYSVLNGGKRLRPALVYATGQIFNANTQSLNAAAAAIELIHCYSLIHDDLPAMDDDDLRRGKPTCHKKFDEATAILAGDALQTLAFDILANDSLNKVNDKFKVKMISTLAKASGINGMILGQTQDLDAENKANEIQLNKLKQIHANKTGALITASIHLGILAAEYENEIVINKLLKFGELIGVLFQIQDDILDVTSTSEIIGKTAGSDIKNNKSTYTTIMGIKESQDYANILLKDAFNITTDLKNNSNLNINILEDIANYFLKRTN